MKKIDVVLGCLCILFSAGAAVVPGAPLKTTPKNSVAAPKAEAAPATASKTFTSLVLRPAEIDAIKTAKLVYKISGPKIPEAMLVLNCRRPDTARLDYVTEQGNYSILLTPEGCWQLTSKAEPQKLSAEEEKTVRQDAMIYPIPLDVSAVIPKRKALPDEKLNGELCHCYKMKLNDGSGLTTKLWYRTSDGLLVKALSRDEEGIYVTEYADYEPIDGMMTASTIRYADMDGARTLKLQSAQWNVKLRAGLFKCPIGVVAKNEVSVPGRNVKAKFSKPSQTVIDRMIREGQTLRLEIQTDEEALKKLEKMISVNKASATRVAASENNVVVQTPRAYVSGGKIHYRYNHLGADLRSGRTRRRALRNIDKENKKAYKDYEELSSNLVSKRLALSEIEAKLARWGEKLPALPKTENK